MLPNTPARTEMRPTGLTYRQKWEAADMLGRGKVLEEAGIRVGALKREAPEDMARIPNVDLSGRDDEIVWLHSAESVVVAMAIPRNVSLRATGVPADPDFRDVSLAEIFQDLSVPA